MTVESHAHRLAGHDLADLEAQTGAVYALDRELRLVFSNQAWFRFAAANGGGPSFADQWPVGRAILEAFPAEIREFYRRAYFECLARGNPWEHEYECSSPENYRRFHQLVYRLGDESGLLVINSLVVEREHDRLPGAGGAMGMSDYQDQHGIVHMCCHCRRVKVHGEQERWDWVPDLLAVPPVLASHGLCRLCFVHYYPDLV